MSHARTALGLLAPLLLALPACSAFISVPAGPPPPPEEVLTREFTPQELAADLDDLFAIIEEIHPDPYTVVPRDEMLRRRAELVAGLDRPLLRRDFQPRVAELVATLGDGHTTVYLPQDEWWRGPASTCFPIDVAWDGAALWVRHTAVVTEGGDLGVGSRILAISGRPAEELFRKFMAQRSGETEAFRAQGVELAFPMHLWLEGLPPPWKLKFESAVQPGRNFSVDITGMSWNVVARGPAPASGERWRLERRDDGAALLTIDTLAAEVDEFEDFLEATFEQLKAAPPDVLVIDLRRNGGGDSRLGDELLEYIAHKPWRQASRKEWKMSERYRDYFKTHLPAWIRWLPVQYLHPVGWDMWTTPEGECLIMDEDLIEPRDEELRYDGPVAFLIGPGTFSSAKSLALAVKDCGLALLVGEPTGGVANSFGEVYPFQLPRTRLGAQVSSALTVRPNGDAASNGPVEPDVLVKPAPGETGDVVLERAIEALRASRAQGAAARTLSGGASRPLDDAVQRKPDSRSNREAALVRSWAE